ncbi:MAG: GreA/GreB family elongation factor [Deltaproteobacteria bacterium]|nr:GreA/GreB family elongation factor [Deltaproteobacteria bacterium]
MSKAFTKDDGWEEPVVAPRAPLPDGVPNYVTPRGLRLLRAELAELEAQRQAIAAAGGDELEQRRRTAIVGRRLSELGARLASAQVVDPAQQAHELVRFGATVRLRGLDDERERTLTIVGVDEADPAHGRVAFTAPLARALIGRAVGETVSFATARGEDELEVLAISYGETE